MKEKLEKLRQRGVTIVNPLSVEIDPAVDPERIGSDVVIHAGCRVRGADTSIGPGCVLGEEAPATVDNCQLGRDVAIKGGYAAGSVFLDSVSIGSGAHIRPGCILEEHSSAAHTVGLKQAILLPFVTAGSLVNFCDALMAGGTGRGSHSEIGSSYVHFNFTAHGDKATASLLGDVPRGVMLDQAPIFLGGQGGLVGPTRMEYGTVVPAGSVCRHDALEGGRIHLERPLATSGSLPYRPEIYSRAGRIVRNNLIFLGNLIALSEWYAHVRPTSVREDYASACLAGAGLVLELAVTERTRRLRELAGKLATSVEALRGPGGDAGGTEADRQEKFIHEWPRIEGAIRRKPWRAAGNKARDRFLEQWEAVAGSGSHLDAVGRLTPESREIGTRWLQGIVDGVSGLWS